jgi:hypothetical protein
VPAAGGTIQLSNLDNPSSDMAYFPLLLSFNVKPCTAATSATSSFSIGVSLTAFQFSPSMKIRALRESIGVNAVTVLPTIVSAPARTGSRCARKPFPTTRRKNALGKKVARQLFFKSNTVTEPETARPGFPSSKSCLAFRNLFSRPHPRTRLGG